MTSPASSAATAASLSQRRSSGLVLAVASALSFASSGPVIKPLLEAGWSLGAVLLARMGLSALLLAPILVVAIRRRPGLLRQWRIIVGFGLTAVAGTQIFFFAALQRMPVAVALLIEYLAPVLLVGLAWARTRRAPSKLVLAGTIVAVGGLVLVVDITGAHFDLIGTLLALCAAVCIGAYFLVADRTGDDLPPLALAAGGMITATTLVAALCAVGVLPFAAPAVSVVLAGIQVPWWLPVLWVAGVATTMAYVLGVISVPRIGSRVASFVGLSEVLFALGFAWLLLGETPAPVQYVGGALILVGVVLVRMDGVDAPRSARRSVADVPRGVTPTLPDVPVP